VRRGRKIRITSRVRFGLGSCLAGCLGLALTALILSAAASPAGAVNSQCDWPDATVTFSGTYTDTDQNPTVSGGPLGGASGYGDASYALTLHWTSTVTGPMAGDLAQCFPPDQATLALSGSFSFTPSPGASDAGDTACSTSFSTRPGVTEYDYALGFANSPTGVPKGNYEPAEVEGFPPSDAASLGGVTSSDPSCWGTLAIGVGPSFDPDYSSTTCANYPPPDFSGPAGAFEVPCIAFGYDLTTGQTLGPTSHTWSISYDGSDQYGGTESTSGSETLSFSATSCCACSAGSGTASTDAAVQPALSGRRGPAASAASASQPNLVFFSARGSSEEASKADPLEFGSPGLALFKVLEHKADAAGVSLYAEGDSYPAVDIQLGFYLDYAKHKAATTHYRQSVAAGVSDGVRQLKEMASKQDATGKCWALVLTGYSQGAEVIRRLIAALPDDISSHLAAVELFGDPYFVAGDTYINESGDYARDAIGVRQFAWINFHNGPAPPPLPVEITYSWCHSHDLVCGFNNSLFRGLGLLPGTDEGHGHFTYNQNACEAADQVSRALIDRRVYLGSGC